MTSMSAFLFGYLLGSIPFGLIFTRAVGGPDLRSIGSGNIGATNVLRTGRKGIAVATLICDMLKGTLAVLATSIYVGSHDAGVSTIQYATLAAAFGAFAGHLFPAWLKFKGGKGVATYIGLLLGIYWPVALIFCAIWLLVARMSHFSSLAALVASALTPSALWLLGRPEAATLFLALTVLLWAMHRANIARILNGTESKIGAKNADDQPN
jgi:glycerol-3-phosphate acyltransferase PlsY